MGVPALTLTSPEPRERRDSPTQLLLPKRLKKAAFDYIRAHGIKSLNGLVIELLEREVGAGGKEAA